MKQYSKRMILSVFSLLFVFVSAGGSVAMANETEGSDDPATHESNEMAKEKVNNLVEKFRSDAKKTVRDELRAKESEKIKQTRQKVCENRKNSINARITRTENFAASYKEKLDSIYTKVKTFHDSKNLTVANYDQLTAAVDAAQADAAAKVAALKAVNTTVDCTQQNVADGLSAYRSALSVTRDSLKTYKSTLLDLMKAIREAAKSSEQ